MLLTISTTYSPARDLGFLMGKHPDKFQEFSISYGKVYFFFPEATDEKCTAALILDINPIEIIRNYHKNNLAFALQQYVNDRPYVASSFISTAIALVLSSALNGKCKEKPELVDTPMPFTVTISVLSVSGSESIIYKLFSPLDYEIILKRHPLDDSFPDWGKSQYYTVILKNTLTLKDMLSHLYLLIPVFDNDKHYWVDNDEIEKLLSKGGDWLRIHPEKEFITKRYLKNIKSLSKIAIARLAEDVPDSNTEDVPDFEIGLEQDLAEKNKNKTLNEFRFEKVVNILCENDIKSVLDAGCGEGNLLRKLIKVGHLEKITGFDVSYGALEKVKEKLRFDEMSPRQKERIELIQGSLVYIDDRLLGYDAIVMLEVIEHIDNDRLEALEKVIFTFAKPKIIVISTPNYEYNIKFEKLLKGKFRHSDHRFEWTRLQFRDWAEKTAEKYGYSYELLYIGEMDSFLGTPTQMAIFKNGNKTT